MDGQLAHNPFLVFPEEIWEVILEFLDHTEDILNVFEAYPQLEILATGKQFSWLISNLLPFIYPKLLNFEDFKNCRLVSKRWNNAIGSYLDTHPDRLPYKSPSLKRSRENHFTFHHLPNITTNFRKLNRSGLCSNANNPFPGHYVNISLEKYLIEKLGIQIKGIDRGRVVGLGLREVIPVLEGFGRHIWYLTLELPLLRYWNHPVILEDVIKPLFNQCLLHNLPNLKSLKIIQFDIFLHDYNPNDGSTLETDTFTGVGLETLDLWNCKFMNSAKNLHHTLLTIFVNPEHLKKLTINTVYWLKHYNNLFPNLTELGLFSAYGIPTVPNILQQLTSPHLGKLRIWGSSLIPEEILEMLVAYPNIGAVELVGGFKVRKGINSPKLSSKRNSYIQYLTLHTSPELNFPFLPQVPSLKFLTIHFKRYLPMENHTNLEDSMQDFLSRSYKNIYVYKKEFGCIWELMPELKMLTLVTEDHTEHITVTHRYVRECGNKVFTTINH